MVQDHRRHEGLRAGPDLLFVRDDAGWVLSPVELLEGWRQVGTVEQLPDGVDPEAVMRESWRPHSIERGGNLGFGGRT
jgi:hypothetical protein